MCTSAFCTTLAFFHCLLADGHLETNPVYRELTEVGIARELDIVLPSPFLGDDLTQAEQQEILNRLVPRTRREQFFRESLVAPQIIDQGKTESVSHLHEDGSVRHVDFWYMAYGKFEQLATDDFLNKVGTGFESDDDAEHDKHILDVGQLEARGLTINEDYERLAHVHYTLLKKVRLRGTVRSHWSETDDSVLAATMLDPEFRDDAELGNQWRSLTRDDAGELQVGATAAYDGAGGYLKLTRINGSDRQIFIEGHLAFFEPTAWFRGANLLGSKLPAMIQSSVRSTRKAILRASREAVP